MSDADQRRAPRRRLPQFLPVYDDETHELVGRMVDLSRTGFMVISGAPILCEQAFRFRIPLDDGSEPLIIHATSMWSRPASHAGHHGAGFAFTDISLAALTALERVYHST